MNATVNTKKSIRPGGIWNNQRGSLIIGIIITIIIFSVLGSAMVYIFSSSALNPVSGNFAQQAYYNAESGFRYIAARYRNTGDKTVFDPYTSPNTPPPIPFPGGGEALVEVDPLSVSYVPGTATANLSGSDLVLDAVNDPDRFPDEQTFFSKDSDPDSIYRYSGRNLETLESGQIQITLTGIIPVPGALVNEDITTREHARITSTGKFGNVNRRVIYSWVLSGTGSGGPGGGGGYSEGDQDLLDLPDMTAPYKLSEDPLGRFEVVPDVPNPNTAVLQGNVDGDLGISINLASGYEYIYVNINWWNLATNLNVNKAYQAQGNTLSYELQLKQMETSHLDNFLIGVSFRVESNAMLTNQFYGMSIFFSESGQQASKIPNWLKNNAQLSALAKDTYYLVFWEMNNNVMTVIESRVIPTDTATPTGTTAKRADWPTLVLKIEETGTGLNKTNTISAIIYDKNENPRGSFNWPSDTDWQNPLYTGTDSTNTTGDLTAIPVGRPEIGIHAFADSGADNKIFLDDFAVKMEGAGPGTGTVYHPPVQN
jgi:hypothetical protein